MTMSKIQHYFIILSEHNIAEYRACLHLQPENVHLIVTQRIAKQNAHIRFKNTLEESGKFHGKVHEIGFQKGNKLIGERTTEIQTWLNKAFQNYLTSHQINNNAVLNITGGTKALSMLLAHHHNWQELHYQPFQPRRKQIYIDKLNPQTLQFIGEIRLSNRFSLRDGLKLYADKIGNHSPNPITQHPDSLPLAQMRFAAQSLTQPQNDNLFPAITPVLERVWQQPDLNNQKEITLTWQEFQGAEPIALQTFFTRLANLIEPTNRIRITETGLTLPTKYKKNSQIGRQLYNWKKWISGDWFEQLIYTWLRENGVPAQNIETGLQPATGESNGNETDILLFHKNQLIFCELKSALSPHTGLQEPLRQLLEQTDNMGKVRRVLILSPIIKAQVQDKWSDFEHRCASKHIQIIVADQPSALSKLLR